MQQAGAALSIRTKERFMPEPNDKIALKLDQIKKRLDKEIKADSKNREDGIACMKMIDGEGHWSPDEENDRRKAGRPCLVINQLPKYLNQATGEQLQNMSQIEIRPMSNNANIQIAKIREGYVRQIEYDSNADIIYAWGSKHKFAGGLGAWRVITTETDENPFIQTIKIQMIENAFNAYLENGGRGDEPNYGFILHKMNKDDFDAEYGEVGGSLTPLAGSGYSYDTTSEENQTYFGEYFERQHEEVEMCLFDDGTILPRDKANERIKKWEEKAQEKIEQLQAQLRMAESAPPSLPSGIPPAVPQAPPQGGIAPNAATAAPQGMIPPNMAPAIQPKPQGKPEIVKTKKTKKIIVKRFLFNSEMIFNENGLDGERIAGKYIPIVLDPGRQMNIAGKVSRSSIVKDALGSQKFLDFEVSAAAEITALQPKAPWLATAEMIEGYEQDYKQANIKNFAFLLYKIDPLAPDQRPTRQGPGEPPAAIFQLINQADGWIKSTIGQFNADVGAEGPERSGTAIRSRQKPGDTGTFEFFASHNKSVERTGKIINAMIPEVIDSARDLPVRAQNDIESWVPVNTTAGDALDRVLANPERYKDMNVHELYKLVSSEGRGALYNMLGVGEYGVRAKAGASYASQREETAANMERVLQYAPTEIPFYMDLIAEYQDWPGSDEFVERARKKLPPGLARPRPGEKPPQPPPPNPQMLLALAEIEAKKAEAKFKQTKAITEQIKAIKELQESKPEMEKVAMDVLKRLLAEEEQIGQAGIAQPAQG